MASQLQIAPPHRPILSLFGIKEFCDLLLLLYW